MEHRGTAWLNTQRLILRQMYIDDSTEIFNSWASNKNSVGTLQWDIINSLEDMNNWLERYKENIKDKKYYSWGIFLKDTKKSIGLFTAMGCSTGESAYEIKYILGNKYIGKQYEDEAFKVVVQFLTRIVKLKDIQCTQPEDSDIAISNSVINELGFKFTKEDKTYRLNTSQIFMSEVNSEYLVFELPLYRKIEVVWDDFKEVSVERVHIGEYGEEYPYTSYETYYPIEFQVLIDFISKSTRIYGKCPQCEKGMPWDIKEERLDKDLLENCIRGYTDDDIENEDAYIPDRNNVMKNRIKKLIFQKEYFDKIIECPICKNKYKVSYKITDQVEKSGKVFLQKIGQFPCLSEFSEFNSNVYVKLLKKMDAREDFQNAFRLQTDGYNIAAYTYLRRVLEKFILYKFYEESTNLSCTLEEFKKMRINEKFELLKEYLPNYLFENKHVYSIISAGIHTLIEEECSEYFPIVKSIIEIMLLKEEEDKNKRFLEEEKRKELNQVHNKIANRLSIS